MEYPGVWRYWPRIPPDVDDTALCSLAIGPRALLLFYSNIERILSNRDAEGRFLTWMMGPGLPNFTPDLCPVVNANVISYLGNRPDGGWPGSVHYVASPPLVEQSLALAQGPVYWFFTEAIPTACCIEVLARFLRRRRR